MAKKKVEDGVQAAPMPMPAITPAGMPGMMPGMPGVMPGMPGIMPGMQPGMQPGMAGAGNPMMAMMQMMQMMMGGGLAPAVMDPAAMPFTGSAPVHDSDRGLDEDLIR